MTGEQADGLGFVDVPESYRFIVRSRRHVFTVGMKLDALQNRTQKKERCQQLLYVSCYTISNLMTHIATCSESIYCSISEQQGENLILIAVLYEKYMNS